MLNNTVYTQNPVGVVSSTIYGVLFGVEPLCAAAFRQLYPEPIESDIGSQIQAANRFWRSQLAFINTPEAVNAKLFLEDGIDLELWVRNFHSGVLPFILKYDLPRNYGSVDLEQRYDIDKICASLASCNAIEQGG